MTAPIGRSDIVRATHEYSSTGTFVAQLTVAGRGGAATGSAAVTVRSLDGRWSNSSFNASTNRQETRVFQLTQSGSGLTGSYVNPGGVSQAVTGSLSSPRTIRIIGNGQTIASGTELDRDGVNGDVSAFTVRFTGGSDNGQRLTFVRQ